MGFGLPPSDREPGVGIRLLSAGLGGCTADLFTFPLDTAKVRLQVQNVRPMMAAGGAGGTLLEAAKYRGVAGTLMTIAREEGPRALYGGLAAGLQRQLCFASVRIGAYDSARDFYASSLNVNEHSNKASQFLVRIAAGLSTGAFSVLIAQPTDVVKIRMQASVNRYSGCIDAYSRIARMEGLHGLWKGTSANIARTAIVNVGEVVSYDLLKTFLLSRQLMADQMPCHFTAAFGAGFITTIIASPVDVVKTRFMNSPSSYANVIDCAVQMLHKEGASAFYKGFWPSFLRLSSWSVCLFVSMEQFKRGFLHASDVLK